MSLIDDAPGTAGTEAEGNFETAKLRHESYVIEKHFANVAWDALGRCSEEDAAFICATFLAELETGGPRLGDLLGTAVRDASWWADCATVHELIAYGMAALDRLRDYPLSLDFRKRLFFKLWKTFPSRVQSAVRTFLADSEPGSQRS